MQTKKLKSMPLYMNITKQKTDGVIYTPEWVVRLILDDIGYKNNIYSKSIIDPSCGEGAFLIEIVKRFIKDCKQNKLSNYEIIKLLSNNIYGWDIDVNSINKCKFNLLNICRQYDINNVDWNIFVLDSLDRANVRKHFNHFDFVVGNPPYIRIQHLGPERRKLLQKSWSFCANGSTDIFIAFFELGYNFLNLQGRLGYITPNTFFKTKTAERLRSFLSTKKCIRKIIDFGYSQVFEDATTYSAITILDKACKKDTFYFFKGNQKDIHYVDEIKFSNLGKNNWILTSNNILKKIRKIEEKGVPLGKMAKIHVGITTLADDYYIFKNPIIKEKKTRITLKDGRSFIIETKILKPIIKASVLKSSDEEQNRYIIFPYKKINGKHIIIPERDLYVQYPLTYRYFLSIKERLSLRDKGKPNPVAWYAFGRSQGIDTSFGKKILTSGLNLKPNFIVWEEEEYTFYAGYCIKFDGDLHWLADELNSEEMDFYIRHTSRDYQNGYKSYSKTFIENFGIVGKQVRITPKNYLNRIIQGDVLQVLRKLDANIFDVGITSPPYNKQEKQEGWLVKNVVYDNYSDRVPEKVYQDQQIKVLDELYRVTKPGGSFFYNHKIRWERGKMLHPYFWVAQTKWVVRQEIIWNRTIAGNIRGWRFWQIDERIYWLIKLKDNNTIGEELQSRHALLKSIWDIFPERSTPHPAPFPIELPTRCIYSILNENKGIVIDPYAGSGTTLVAAKLLGMDYLGIEISPEYINIAKERLKNCENERLRLQMELAKHKVSKSFKQRKENGEWVGRFRKDYNIESINRQLRLLEEQRGYSNKI